jgi:hypothetical protein
MREERSTSSSIPNFWITLAFVLISVLAGSAVEAAMSPGYSMQRTRLGPNGPIVEDVTPGRAEAERAGNMARLSILGLGGIYWLFCVYRLQSALAARFGSQYSISPARGALLHLIPGFNLYWAVKWTQAAGRLLNASASTGIGMVTLGIGGGASPEPPLEAMSSAGISGAMVVGLVLMDLAFLRPSLFLCAGLAVCGVAGARLARHTRRLLKPATELNPKGGATA